jgi:endonuclease/exonuclease/phosphatase family metal-dependent hydrolase
VHLKLAIAAWALCIALLASCSEPDASRSRPEPVASSSLAATTFNIRYGTAADGENRWGKRRDLVLEVLRDGGDILGLQEALPFQVREIADALPAFAHVSRTREQDPSAGEACPIFWRTDRFELDVSEQGVFWLSETPDVPGSKSWDAALPRIATFVRLVERGSGKGLYVFNTHLDHRGASAREEGAKVIARRIATRRHSADAVIVLGDFNDGPTSKAVGALLESGMIDAWRSANPDAREQGTFNGWKDRVEGERIDHVLVAPSLGVVRATIDDRRPGGRWPSDHLPVRVEVSWPPAGSAGETR